MSQPLRYVLLVCVFLFAFANQTKANPFSDAQTATRKGDYTKAASIYKSLAEHGSPLGQLLLGMKYYDGQGVPHDLVRAYMWINLAASSADSEKQKTYIEISELVAKQMTESQITEAWELTIRCTANKLKGC